MKLIKLQFPAMVIATICSGVDVMTFDSEPVEIEKAYTQGAFYEENDYRLYSPSEPVSPLDRGGYGRFNPEGNTTGTAVPNDGSIYARIYSGKYYPYLKRINDEPFSLVTLDVGEYSSNANNAQSLFIIGTTEGGEILEFSLDIDQEFGLSNKGKDFQTYKIEWTNLVKVEFATSGVSIDNIRLASGTDLLNNWYYYHSLEWAWNSIYGWLYFDGSGDEVMIWSQEGGNWLLDPK